jgi:FkbM family methyltransferase
VEPIPSLAAALERRAAAEGLVQLRVLPRALGAVAETRGFTWVTGGSGLSGLQRRAMPEHLTRTAEAIRVPVVRLDEVLADRTRRLAFVKLDLEGGELHALQGAVTLLREDRPLLAFENGRETAAALYGYTRHEWFGFFRRQGYAVFDILGRPFGLEDWERPNLPWYFVALPAGGEEEAWLRELLPRRLPALAEAAKAATAAARPG